jgi:hypothetical protein
VTDTEEQGSTASLQLTFFPFLYNLILMGYIINWIFVVATILGLLWAMVGIPVGIVFFVMMLKSKTEQDRRNSKKLTWIGFSSIIFLLAVFILYVLLNIILAFFGRSISSV